MGFFIRKSKKLGSGIRLNFSKSGLGVSYGFKGFRISHNSRGTYLNAGTKGLYFRTKLDKKIKTSKNLTPQDPKDIERGWEYFKIILLTSLKAFGLTILVIFFCAFADELFKINITDEFGLKIFLFSFFISWIFLFIKGVKKSKKLNKENDYVEEENNSNT